MNYVILNTNGSVLETHFDDYIQRGSDKSNHIKVAYADSHRDGLSARLSCSIPNETSISLVGTADYFNYKNKGYLGWDIPLTLAATLYAGNINCSLTVTDGYGATLVQYPFTLRINDSGYPHSEEDFETRLTLDEYNQLFAYIQSIKGDIVIVDSFDDLPETGFEKTLYVVKNETLAEGYVWKDGWFKLTDRDFTLECLRQAKAYTDQKVLAEKTRAEAKEQALVTKDNELAQAISDSNDRIGDIEDRLPEGDIATMEDVKTMASHYLTYNADGGSFPTLQSLLTATTFYWGDQTYEPTENDFAYVQADESHEGKSTRWAFTNGRWSFQYIINDAPLTEEQMDALNSGITSGKLETIQTDISSTSQRLTEVDEDLSQRITNVDNAKLDKADLVFATIDDLPNIFGGTRQ